MSRSLTALALLVPLAVTLPALAQQPSEQEMMQRWMAAAAPGEGHKFLENFVGSWTWTSRLWTQPGAPPATSNGTSEVKWIMDGRYIEDMATGSMMGMPMTGRGISGYDNVKKKYVAIWVDNLGTAISVMEGQLDQTGRVLTYYGRMDDAATGEMGKMIKYVLRVNGPDSHTFEMHDLSIVPGEQRVMEIAYTRKK